MSIRGAVDRLHEGGASGWIYLKGTTMALTVEAVLLGRIVGEATANLERPDLAAVGFGDGLCGFDVNFYQRIERNLLPFVSIRPQGADVELPRTNLTGFVEFFSFINSRYPRAGTFRSVLGGLWVDRSDALQVLEGRMAVNLCKPSTAEFLKDLIVQGYVQIPCNQIEEEIVNVNGLKNKSFIGVVEASQDSGAPSVLESILHHFSEQRLLDLLRSIFDDNPLICRTEFVGGDAGAFKQPSALEALPSPAECVLLVSTVGDTPCEVDIVVGSHEMPEFTADGRSRWVSKDAATAVEIAVSNGASVKTLVLGKADVAILGPGTIYRMRSMPAMRATSASKVVACLAVPKRQTPHYFLTNPGSPFRISHISGAALVA
jgi:hypothetical protein